MLMKNEGCTNARAPLFWKMVVLCTPEHHFRSRTRLHVKYVIHEYILKKLLYIYLYILLILYIIFLESQDILLNKKILKQSIDRFEINDNLYENE